MRLFELFENVPSSVTRAPLKSPTLGSFNSEWTPNAGKRVTKKGEGSYGSVFQDRDNPHEVMKFSKRDEWGNGKDMVNYDGYLVYLQEIAKDEEIQDNPWVPRIQKFRLHKNDNNDVIDFSVRLEALEPLDSLTVREVLAVSERTFTPTLHAKIERAIKYSGIPKHTAISHLVSAIRDCITKTSVVDEMTDDEKLIEFAYWHESIHEIYDRNLDIREANIMIRRSPYGVQPVITDPWS